MLTCDYCNFTFVLAYDRKQAFKEGKVLNVVFCPVCKGRMFTLREINTANNGCESEWVKL